MLAFLLTLIVLVVPPYASIEIVVIKCHNGVINIRTDDPGPAFAPHFLYRILDSKKLAASNSVFQAFVRFIGT